MSTWGRVDGVKLDAIDATYDYDEIIDALEGEEDDAADSDAGEDYELAG